MERYGEDLTTAQLKQIEYMRSSKGFENSDPWEDLEDEFNFKWKCD